MKKMVFFVIMVVVLGIGSISYGASFTENFNDGDFTSNPVWTEINNDDCPGTQEAASPSNFSEPSGIAIDTEGNVYVVDEDLGCVQQFTPSGKFMAKWGSKGTDDGQFFEPSGMAVDSQGHVYVVEKRYHRVQKFTSSGEFITNWGSRGTGDGEFTYPMDVAIDNRENVYVLNTRNQHRVQKFTSSGEFITKWGSGSSGSCDGEFFDPFGIAVDGQGHVYVADTYNHRVQKFTLSGKFITKWGRYGSSDGRFYRPRGIAVDDQGNVYVADTGNERIQKFTSSGEFITKWGSEGSNDGQFKYPNDLATDNQGHVYVVDNNNIRIQKFTSSGKFITKWGTAPTPSKPATPSLVVTTNGTKVTLSWSEVDNATGYILSYAPYPDISYINQVDLGDTSTKSFDLWDGAAFYVAIQSYNSHGQSGYSNIEYFILDQKEGPVTSTSTDSNGISEIQVDSDHGYRFEVVDENGESVKGIQVRYSEENGRRVFEFSDNQLKYSSGLLFGTDDELISLSTNKNSLGLKINRDPELFGTVIFIGITLCAITAAELQFIDGAWQMQCFYHSDVERFAEDGRAVWCKTGEEIADFLIGRKDIWFSTTKTVTAFLGFATVGASGQLVTIADSGIELTKGALESSRGSIIDLIYEEYANSFGQELGWNEKRLVYSWDLRENSQLRRFEGGIIVTDKACGESLEVLPSSLNLSPGQTGTCTIVGGASPYSAGSYDTFVATASVSGNELTITAKLEGSTRIMVRDSASHSVEVSVTVSDEPGGETWTDPVTGMEFVWVPGGCYQMGCGDWTDSCYDNEYPVHEVCLDGFWIGRYEVTQGQWKQIMGNNPSYNKSGDDFPVEQVSWNDCQNFITALNGQGSNTFRLPTEAEWEYAARSGGNEEKYAGGSDLDSLGWYYSNSGNHSHAVGTKNANGLGVYDMSGNVYEWCSDWYGSSYYSSSPVNNPQGPTTGSYRVMRGGYWYRNARYCRSAYRNSCRPDLRHYNIGFRLVLSPGQQ